MLAGGGPPDVIRPPAFSRTASVRIYRSGFWRTDLADADGGLRWPELLLSSNIDLVQAPQEGIQRR